MLCEKRNINISKTDIRHLLSNHIILLGYNRGCNQFIKSIREETDIPIAIFSDTSQMAEITNIAVKYPNILHLEGDPLNLEHLGNANIEGCKHVVIPCSTENNLCESDCNAVIKANSIKQNWPEVKISVEFSSNSKAALIENFLDQTKDVLMKDGGSTYMTKSYCSGKIFSSVLFTRMSAMKSLENTSYETITALLQYMFNESNFMTIEIPEEITVGKNNLTYGKVRDFLLLNNRITLTCIGVYAINLKDAREDFDPPLDDHYSSFMNASINRRDSEDESNREASFHRILGAFTGNFDVIDVYEQFISELNETRTLVMHPYSDYQLHPRDYLLCMGEMSTDTQKLKK